MDLSYKESCEEKNYIYGRSGLYLYPGFGTTDSRA